MGRSLSDVFNALDPGRKAVRIAGTAALQESIREIAMPIGVLASPAATRQGRSRGFIVCK
jgi:hypothetical protein